MRFAILASVLTALICGCATQHVQPVDSHPTLHAVTATPQQLKPTAKNLDRLIILCVVVVGLSAGAYFVAPVTHQVSITIATGAGTTLGVSLLLRVTLWLVPWIAVALSAVSLIALAYELYSKFNSTKSVSGTVAGVEADATAVASTVTTTLNDIAAAMHPAMKN